MSDSFEESVVHMSGVVEVKEVKVNDNNNVNVNVDDPLDMMLYLLKTKTLFGKNREITYLSFPQLTKEIMWTLWTKGAIKIDFPSEYIDSPSVQETGLDQWCDPWGEKMFRS